MKERVYLWDNLKVVLMMLVVITHSVNVYQLDGSYWVQYLWVFIMTFTMPLFMMISGFWFKPRELDYSLKHYLYPFLLFSVLNISLGTRCGAYPNGVVWTKGGWAMWYIWSLFIYNLLTPILLDKMGLRRLLLCSLVLAIVCGFRFPDNNIADIQRVVNFYPFFVIGMVLRKYQSRVYLMNQNGKLISGIVFIMAILSYLILCYFRPGFCYGTGFMHVHGLSITGFVSKWLNFALCVALSISVIALMPNRKLPFSKYGSRTMTVYMLHMSIVFPLCWVLLRPVMYEWYGYVLYIVGVPFVCAFLFNEKVDSIMKVILSLPDRIFNKCR